MINNSKYRKELQLLSLTNFNLTHDNASKLIDNYRYEIINLNNKKLLKNKKLKILHVTNFNERHNGRLFIIQVKELIMGS